MNVNKSLSELLGLIGKNITVQVDRPIGSKHPMNESMTYPINFGQTSDIKSELRKNVDVYVMGVDEPCDNFHGTCIAVVYPPRNKGFRLIVAPEGKRYNFHEMTAAVDFQERFFKSKILRKAF